MFTITSEQLHKIMPNLKLDRAEQLIPYLLIACNEFQTNTELKVAALLGNLAIESRELNTTEENLNYSIKGMMKTFNREDHIRFTLALAQECVGHPDKIANVAYANKIGNGNIASGDGYRFRGRGFLQITGKENYVKTGKALSLDLLNNPDLLTLPLHAFRSATYYFKSHGLNEKADTKFDSIKKFGEEIVEPINAAKLDLEGRFKFYRRSLEILGVK